MLGKPCLNPRYHPLIREIFSKRKVKEPGNLDMILEPLERNNFNYDSDIHICLMYL